MGGDGQELPVFIKSEDKKEEGEKKEEEEEEQTSNVEVAPRVYCLISKYPYFSMHYDILYCIIGFPPFLLYISIFK